MSYLGFLNSWRKAEDATLPRCGYSGISDVIVGDSQQSYHGMMVVNFHNDHRVLALWGCCSLTMQDSLNRYFGPPQKRGVSGVPIDALVEPRVTELRLKQYVKWLCKWDSEVEELIQKYPPTYKLPFVFLGAKSGYKNYVLMCLWRYLWYNPKRVLAILRLDELGYTPTQCIVISICTSGQMKDEICNPYYRYIYADTDKIVNAIDEQIDEHCPETYSWSKALQYSTGSLNASLFPSIKNSRGTTIYTGAWDHFGKENTLFTPEMLKDRTIVDNAFNL